MFKLPVFTFGITIRGYGFVLSLPLFIDIYKGKDKGLQRYIFNFNIKVLKSIYGPNLTY